MTSRPPADLKPLTSLRFFAAAMIVALHLQETLDVPWPDVSDRGLRQGVTFFFVLSGFILTHVYSDQPGLTVRTFLTLRLARLYPTQLAALLLLVLLLPWREIVYTSPSADVSATALVAKLLLIDALWPTAPLTYSWNGVSWSLSTEMFFYLAFPLLL
ncbi:MAG: acyltransferase, partial [Roseiarcus sp.]